MKRFLTLALLVIFCVSGCASKETAFFYFCRAEYPYETEQSVIVGEKRDISGHTGHLDFLISLYLMGPLDMDYVSPFPTEVKLISTEFKDSNLTISLSEIKALSDSEYTLACACMALTCVELTNAETVTVNSGSRCVTIDPNMLTLYDSGLPDDTTTGG